MAAAITRREQSALADISDALSALPQDRVSLKTANMVGLDALQTLFDTNTAADDEMASSSLAPVVDAPLSDLVDDIERSGNGLVMCMGKGGGVGKKTTVAAAIAVALAERGHDVHLTTTDPAAHLVETLQGGIEHLRVSRIDPIEASDAYRERVMTTKGAHLDDAGRATLAEDLRSPCTEEVAVFQAFFSKVIHESRSTFVVLDTAPTGHTLLLLDATVPTTARSHGRWGTAGTTPHR